MNRIGFVLALLCLCSVGSATSIAQTISDPNIAAMVAGEAITIVSLDRRAANRLMTVETQRYWLRRAVLEELIADIVLEKEAAARRVTVATLLKTEVEERCKPVSQEEARAVLEAARDRLVGRDEAAIPQLLESMNRQRATTRRIEFLRELRAKWKVETTLVPPRIVIPDSDAPSWGPATAPVHIVEFTDFACPFCVRAQSTVKQVANLYPGKIRLEFRDFPLTTLHPKAAKAAEAAACAAEQRKFWEYHDRLFSSQRLEPADLRQHAADIGLDMKAFDDCYASARHEQDWRRHRAVGESYGVTGTPAFFINGRLVSGAAPIAQFTQVIDEELQAKEVQTSPSPKR